MYGMVTGTIVNGMIQLREIDNDFKIPASNNLALTSTAAIIMGIPLLLLIAQAPRPGNLMAAKPRDCALFCNANRFPAKRSGAKTEKAKQNAEVRHI